MEEITLDSNGKINLGLKVVNRRNDGYHNLKTVMQEIDLKDKVRLKKKSKGISIDSNDKNLPKNEDNLVYKAWEKMKEHSGINEGIDIYIEKNIPVAGGLAGGSSNAAAVLKGLNILWELDYSLEILEEIGLEIGADVPFCLRGGTLLAEGVGNEFTELRSLEGMEILLVNPKIGMSTPEVYSNLELVGYNPYDMDRIIQAIDRGDRYELGKSLVNDLETAVDHREELKKIKKAMLAGGALGSLMSGSGPTIFGIFQDEKALDSCSRKMEEEFDDYLIIKSRTI